MPEPKTFGARWRAGSPVRVGSVTLLPIERIAVHGVHAGALGWLSATLEPIGLVVHDATGLRTLGLGEQPVSLAELRERVEGLDDMLAGL